LEKELKEFKVRPAQGSSASDPDAKAMCTSGGQHASIWMPAPPPAHPLPLGVPPPPVVHPLPAETFAPQAPQVSQPPQVSLQASRGEPATQVPLGSFVRDAPVPQVSCAPAATEAPQVWQASQVWPAAGLSATAGSASNHRGASGVAGVVGVASHPEQEVQPPLKAAPSVPKRPPPVLPSVPSPPPQPTRPPTTCSATPRGKRPPDGNCGN